jgi:DNA invertase Pin-like site-specific DNA recombinase
MSTAYSYVRFSSPRQARGDSLRRQVERSEEYAKKHGLILDTKLRLHDLGRSAYTGDNIERGALGQFLQAVKQGKVKSGSTLIVESLDRISRAKGRQAFSVFLQLLDANINIVTLIDGKTYTQDADHNDLSMSIGILSRAYDESRTKSDRQSQTWARKRRDAVEKKLPMTSICKPWLKVKPDRSGFTVIEERAQVVRRIFRDCADRGLGVGVIARTMNEEGVKPFSVNHNSFGWSGAFIARLLKSRAVIGEGRPMIRIQGKRKVSKDEPIKDFYPAIVDETLFMRAQSALAKRRADRGGRTGPGVTNLFSKIGACALCGEKTHVVHHRHRYLTCEAATKGLGCRRAFWSLREFERAFLTYVRELDWSFLTDDSGNHEVKEAAQAVQAAEGRLEELRTQRERTFDLVVKQGSSFLENKLKVIEESVVEAEKELADLVEKARTLSMETEALTKSTEHLTELIDRIQSGKEEMFLLRTTLAAQLRDLVKKVSVWFGPALVTYVHRAKIKQEKVERAFVVVFRDGSNSKLVAPTASDPARVLTAANGRIVFTDSSKVVEQFKRESKPGHEPAVLVSTP